jgi:hypothetical protein
MKTYKLWIEIEEHDTATGEYRNVTSCGDASPVPIAEFDTLAEAIRLAELFAMDAGPAESGADAPRKGLGAVN